MATVILESDLIPPSTLESELRPFIETADVRLRLEQTRSAEMAVLTAIVGAGGTALGALISGLLKLATQKGARNLVVHGRSGRKIEFPADTTPDRIAELVELARELDVDKISF
jgi:hypothetical protein